MKCPGHDSGYWTGEVVTEVPCPECGCAVEIFKDESAGRCRRCGHRFPNPGADFGCAQWCSLAKECLGFAPVQPSRPGSAEGALAARLIQWIEQRFNGDPPRIARALKVFQRAKELIRKEGGDPRVALTAALLLAISDPPSGGAAGSSEKADDRSESILPEGALEHLDLEADVVSQVCRIVCCYRRAEEIDSIEFRVVRDSLAGTGAVQDA